jgi:hypothetical protein
LVCMGCILYYDFTAKFAFNFASCRGKEKSTLREASFTLKTLLNSASKEYCTAK